MKKKQDELPIPKTVEGLREALFAEINDIRKGKGNLQRARAIATLSAQIIDSMRVQIQYGRFIASTKEDKPVVLGI